MEILEDVYSTFESLPLEIREARNMALACTIEPLSNKAGCVTRQIDTNKNTLEMFIAGGTNIFPAYLDLARFLREEKSPDGMYKYLHQAILLSKANRKGGQINQGILEFSFPVFASHVLHDPDNSREAGYVVDRATDILRATTPRDVESFWKAKQAGRAITNHGRGKTYELTFHEVETVFDFYEAELIRERSVADGHPTGIAHNRQFIEGFPDIKYTFEALRDSSGRISERAEKAYNAVMSKKDNLGIGPGLAADFVAVGLYLLFTYAEREELIE